MSPYATVVATYLYLYFKPGNMPFVEYNDTMTDFFCEARLEMSRRRKGIYLSFLIN